MHLDGFDLLFVVRIIGGDLNESTVVGEHEMMGSRCLAKSHAGVTFTTLHNARMVIVVR